MENGFKKIPKRNLVLYISIAVILISVTFRTSYAFFVGYVRNLTPPTATVVETGDIDLKFDNNITYLNVNDLSIMSAADAAIATNNYSTFTVTNNGNKPGKYRLYLSNYSITENLVNADFKYKLTVNGTTYTGTFYDLFNGKTATEGVIASTTDDIPLFNDHISLNNGDSHNCEFRVWLEEADHNQIGLTDGTLRTTIRLIAVNE